MKRSTKLLAAVLASIMLAQPLYAAVVPLKIVSVSVLRNTFAKSQISSRIQSGLTLNAKDAAMRLYYLHLLTGTGTETNGSISFDLERDLTRLEGAVMAIRLMGVEEDVLSVSYTHPYTDVPEWAASYIGYLYACGLTESNNENLFQPDAPASLEVFMNYMLYALGYRISEGDYTILSAASLAENAGILQGHGEKPLTRGDAVLAMYNTLRITMKDSPLMLSEKLTEEGRMSHLDAVFLLWGTDAEETQAYMEAVGYTAEWIIPDGYYTIRSEEAKDCVLNVLTDGPNRDYEGLGLALWYATGDITQSFRLERTERGTYLLYAACSKGGFNRLLGVGRDGKSVGLYRAVSANALEFSIQGSTDGTWTISALTKDGEKYLSGVSANSGASIQLSADGQMPAKKWIIEKQGITDAVGQDLALFPAQTMQITQGAYDTYSHMDQNALDMQPTNGMAFAPFHAKVVAVNPGDTTCNGVWIQSIDKVRYADGSYDYMTVLYMHDNDISDLQIGRVLTQGEYFYSNGTKGISTGAHIHLAVYRGQYNENMKFGSGNVYAQEAFFVLDDTIIRNDYGIDWKSVSEAD